MTWHDIDHGDADPPDRWDSCGPGCVGIVCCGPRWSPWGDCGCGGTADHADCPRPEDNEEEEAE